MTTAQIKQLQEAVGAEVDGFWGPESTRRCQEYLRNLMPASNIWPLSDQVSLKKFYGQPGDESKLISIVVSGLGVRYEGKAVNTIRCHQRVAHSLMKIIQELSLFPEGQHYLATYAGVYNNRSVRGGTTPSLHAYGAAIDGDVAKNGNHTHWPIGATMPLKVMEVFAKEGWLSAGVFWSRDAMHFQATRSR